LLRAPRVCLASASVPGAVTPTGRSATRMNHRIRFDCLAVAVSWVPWAIAYASNTPAFVRLDCKEGSRARSGQQLNISCRVKNEGHESVYVLSDDLVLEGPKKGEG
jgi:hypothetical protein